MLYEKRVGSFTRLMKEIRILDSDAGIRMLGTYRGKKCLVFLSKSAGGFTAIVCAVSGTRNPLPGRRLLAVEFAHMSELAKFLRSVTTGHVQAFVY